jgi:hypothetical protein
MLKLMLIFFVHVLLSSCTSTDLELFAPANYADSFLNVGEEQKVHVEVEAQGLSAQVFYLLNPRDLAAGIKLRPTISIKGWAQGTQKYLERDNAQKHHDSMARFSDILALPRTNTIHLLSPRMPALSTRLSSDQSFNIALLKGLSYTFVLNPSGLYDRPPFYWNLEQLHSEENIAFNLDEFGQFITGQIKFDGAKKDQWQVRIIQGDRLVSSVSRVKKNGHFLVELSKPLFLGDEALLTVIIEPHDEESALPRFEKNIAINKLLEQPNLGKINLGRLDKLLTAHITLPGPGSIYLKGRVGNGEVNIKKMLELQGPTIIEEIYEGIYDIAVIPPPESPWGMRIVEKVDISGPIFTMSLKWPKRALLNATVSNKNNKIIAGAQIEFSRLGTAENMLSHLPLTFTATTNNRGQICQASQQSPCEGLALDEGRYEAHIIPPPGSDYAHGWETFDFPLTQKLKFTLLETQKLRGKILGPDQISPVSQAYVTIYAGDSSPYGEAKILANTITDASGSFHAFVPVLQKSY